MALWTPAEITTALWLDAADGDALTLDGSAVSTWNDKSGNERHANNSGGGATRPTLSADAVNSLDAVAFNGTSQFLNITNGLAVETTMTVFEVFQRASSGIISMPMGGSTNGAPPYAIQWWTDNVRYSGLGSSGFSTHGTANTSTGVFISGLFRDASNAVLRFAGVQVSSVTALTLTSASMAYIGRRGSTYHSGLICEIIAIHGALSSDDREKVEGYLAHKWGLEGSLDSGHPYKTDPPELEKWESRIAALGPLASASLLGGLPAESRFSAFGPLADASVTAAAALGAFASATGPLADTSILTLLNLDAEAYISVVGPLASAQFTADTPTPDGSILAAGPLASADILARVPHASAWSAIGPLGSCSITARWQPPEAAAIPSGITYYRCMLTGSPDGLEDAILPITSFSVRHRESTASYYQITIPTLAYVDALTDRPNGQIVIWSDTDGITEELMRGSLGIPRTDRGPNSQAISISGNASRAATTRQTYIITDVLYQYSTFDGEQRLRIRPRAGIRPGDTIRYGDTFFLAGMVSWSVSVSANGMTAQMEVATLAEGE